MGIEVIANADRDRAALYCNTTGIAFGQTFMSAPEAWDAEEYAGAFVNWCNWEHGGVPFDGDLETRRAFFDELVLPIPHYMQPLVDEDREGWARKNWVDCQACKDDKITFEDCDKCGGEGRHP